MRMSHRIRSNGGLTSRPRVTIGVAMFNGQEFVSRARNSILASEYPNFEVLVVDDGSTDDSVEITQGILDPRIRLLRNEKNLGLVATRNRIVQEASGQFLAWLDQDDLMFPHRLLESVSVFERMKDVSVVAGWSTLVSEEVGAKASTLRYPSSDKTIRVAMCFLNPVPFNTSMIRVETLRQTGMLFSPEAGNALDYDLWSRMPTDQRFFILPKILGQYTLHEGQTSRGTHREALDVCARDIRMRYIAQMFDLELTDEDWQAHETLVGSAQSSARVEGEQLLQWSKRLIQQNRNSSNLSEVDLERYLIRYWLRAIYRRRVVGSPKEAFGYLYKFLVNARVNPDRILSKYWSSGHAVGLIGR